MKKIIIAVAIVLSIICGIGIFGDTLGITTHESKVESVNTILETGTKEEKLEVVQVLLR